MSEDNKSLIGSLSDWIEDNPFLGVIFWIFALFALPLGVIFRRDFGKRWLSSVNYSLGFMLVTIFYGFQKATGSIRASFAAYQQPQQMTFGDIFQRTQPTPEKPPEPPFWESLWDGFLNNSMGIILALYVILGIHHLFVIWWRHNTNKPVYSYSKGTSRLDILSEGLMELVNIVAKPVIRLLTYTLPKEEREKFGHNLPPLLNDVSRFSDTIFEPVLFILLGATFFYLGVGTTGTFFLYSGISAGIMQQLEYEALDNEIMDMRDAKGIGEGKGKYRDYIEEGEQAHIVQKIEVTEQIVATPPPIVETPKETVIVSKKKDSLDLEDILGD